MNSNPYLVTLAGAAFVAAFLVFYYVIARFGGRMEKTPEQKIAEATEQLTSLPGVAEALEMYRRAAAAESVFLDYRRMLASTGGVIVASGANPATSLLARESR